MTKSAALRCQRAAGGLGTYRASNNILLPSLRHRLTLAVAHSGEVVKDVVVIHVIIVVVRRVHHALRPRLLVVHCIVLSPAKSVQCGSSVPSQTGQCSDEHDKVHLHKAAAVIA